MTSSRLPPIVCGHRGAAAVVAENTIASFGEAARRGATWIEFDVRPAADGLLVVHHDPTTADGRLVAELTSDQLDSSVPTFGELLAWNLARAEPLGLDVELKTDHIGVDLADFVEAAVAELGEAAGVERIVTSFDTEALDLVRDRWPQVETGLLFHDRSGSWAIETALARGHAAIAPAHALVDRDLVEAAHEAGLRVATWTVNDTADIERVVQAGVDMVIGDDPAVLVDAIRRGATGRDGRS